ncbi:membrin [Chloropicon primus]|uniref:Membrin n=1 Tax=Chloropicon primus TaxID=1764295 RepID=A0A5B8N0Q4_9CHLO|nr:membrin [Chloropicon primus]UPR04560.1 membrin [Chloropicon primus]|eukprot:QDZ25354.1 membrin [Chloropicon primus]
MGDATGLAKEHTKLKKQLLATHHALERLETTEASAHTPAEIERIAQDVGQKLSTLQMLLSSLRGAWNAQSGSVDLSKQTVWKQRLDQSEQEYLNLNSSYEGYLGRHRSREMQKLERQELLQRRGANGGAGRGGMGGGGNSEAQMMRSVAQSNQVIEDIFGQGSAILAGMASQRDRLKRAQRKMLDVLNTLGVSENLLRRAERRMKMDKWIVYGGMVAFTFVLYFTWRLLKS